MRTVFPSPAEKAKIWLQGGGLAGKGAQGSQHSAFGLHLVTNPIVVVIVPTCSAIPSISHSRDPPSTFSRKQVSRLQPEVVGVGGYSGQLFTCLARRRKLRI